MDRSVDQCYLCGAKRWSWMGGRHECMPPKPQFHPYMDFLAPLEPEED